MCCSSLNFLHSSVSDFTWSNYLKQPYDQKECIPMAATISGFYLTFVIFVVFSSPDLKGHVSYCHHCVCWPLYNDQLSLFTLHILIIFTNRPIWTKLSRNHVCEVFYKYSLCCLHSSTTLLPSAVLGLLDSDRLNVLKSYLMAKQTICTFPILIPKLYFFCKSYFPFRQQKQSLFMHSSMKIMYIFSNCSQY